MNLTDNVVYRWLRLRSLHQLHAGCSRGLVRRNDCLHHKSPYVVYSYRPKTLLRGEWSSARTGLRDGGEVLLGVEDVVEEVGQGIHRDQGDDLHHVREGVARSNHDLHIVVSDVPTGLNDLTSDLDSGIPLRVSGMALSGEYYVFSRKLGHMLCRKADLGQAVIAAVH